jgi:hypothetical protein
MGLHDTTYSPIGSDPTQNHMGNKLTYQLSKKRDYRLPLSTLSVIGSGLSSIHIVLINQTLLIPTLSSWSGYSASKQHTRHGNV